MILAPAPLDTQHASPLTFHLLQRRSHELDVLLRVLDSWRRRGLQPAVQLVQAAGVDGGVGRPLGDGVLPVFVHTEFEWAACW